MLAQERCSKIIILLRESSSITVKELSNRFEVSEETIRRDLEKIEKMNIGIRRTHGGAYVEIPDCDIPSHYRETLKFEEKNRIASYCASQVADGDSIMLDASTTALCVAKSLAGINAEITIITNSLPIMSFVKDYPNIELITVGGNYRQKNSSFSGYLTTSSLSQLHATKAFISGMGIHYDFGITDKDETEAQVRKIMIENSEHKYLIADDTKFGKCYANRIASLEAINTIVVNTELSEDWKHHIKSLDIDIQLV